MAKAFWLALAGLLAALALSSNLSLLTVTGTSMNPGITHNDVVVVAPVEPSSLKIGDVVTYSHEVEGATFLFTHRIIAMGDGFIRTKGDSMPVEDGYLVSFQAVKGKVVGTIPYVGFLPRFVHTPTGYLLFIFFPGLLLIGKEALSLRQELGPSSCRRRAG